MGRAILFLRISCILLLQFGAVEPGMDDCSNSDEVKQCQENLREYQTKAMLATATKQIFSEEEPCTCSSSEEHWRRKLSKVLISHKTLERNLLVLAGGKKLHIIDT